MSDNSKSGRHLLYIGIALILIGVIFNEWLITVLFNPIGLMTPELKTIINVFDILCIASGSLLIMFRSRIRGREIAFAGVAFILFLILMEGGVRTYFFIKNRLSPQERTFSEYLGWDIKPNIHSERALKGYGKVSYSTVEYGFRVFGNVNARKTKIFVIGDSVSQAYTASDGETYFDHLRKNNENIEIFAYGCGGYGTLQEYMVLDKYFDLIKPDIILWQFSTNDIVNNSYELESASSINNNHMTRPYYIQGGARWLYPKQGYGWARAFIQSSYLLRFLSIRLRIFSAENAGTIESELSKEHPLFKKAEAATSDIMGIVRKRAGNVPIIAFTADKTDWAGDVFQRITKRHSMHYIGDVPDIINKAKKSGLVVDGNPYDAHWNALGHSLVGKRILEYLTRSALIGGGAHKKRS